MDYNKYIGLPYKDNGRDASGVDCWGLARLFYEQELSIELPSYTELYSGAHDPQVSQSIENYKDAWQVAEYGAPGDLCLFNIYGEPAHVGVYIGDRRFLHAREGRDSVIESLDSAQWSKRFVGFYKYTTKPATIQLTGAPHPLQTQVLYDWTVAGTTVQDLANFVKQKYSVSDRLASKLVILVEGVPVAQDRWNTTVLLEGQTVTYNCVATGGNSTRLLLTLAVVVAAAYLGPMAGQAIAGAGASAGTIAAYTAVSTMALNMAGMALVNAIAPVRMPGQNPDPGSAAGLNLFTGASNQANRFGAIPVVLGKMRATGVLGATPYVDTLTDTSLLNLLVVWGYGPLKVDDICVGTNPISNYYNKKDDTDLEFAQDIPLPVTLYGNATDPGSAAEIAFNKLYGRDVEQQQINIQLVNNAEDGNPWQEVLFAQDNTTAVDLAFTFPEGMRQLVISGGDAGAIREATAAVEIQLRKKNSNGTWPAWAPRPSYAFGDYAAQVPNSDEYSDTINPVFTTVFDPGSGDSGGSTAQQSLYQYHTYALSDSGTVVKFSGAATESQNAEPSASLIAEYRSGSYAGLAGSDSETTTYKRLPVLPLNGYLKLYTVCVFGGTLISVENHLQGYSGYNGLEIITGQLTAGGGLAGDNEIAQTNSGVSVQISSGAVYALSSNQPVAGQSVQVFNTRTNFANSGTVTPGSYSGWSTFLKQNSVWVSGSETTFDKTVTIVFPYTGYYHVEASADDEGTVYVDNRQVVGIPKPGYASTVSNLVYLEAGTYPVRVFAKNSNGGAAGVACNITFNENGGLNNLPTPDTIMVFGTPGFYYKRKDAFNFVYKIKNLLPGIYEARVRRINDDVTEPEESLRNYNKVALLSATAYANAIDPVTGLPQGPINKIPNTNLAKTAIRIQSTSKANGSIDGVNAIVQTICSDWNRTTQQWTPRATSNPASLFAYVLTHSGNAYRIKTEDIDAQIDVVALQKWHEFCDDNQLEFNSVVTQTQSVMDVLRDICAAGRASPSYVDGKWTVVVDKPRDYVTQHFTPHNSWGFESTKLLPRLPDAFRVTFANRDKAYQADEILVFNFGKTSATAEIFEELSLPGVTNARQAKHLARWHLAQTKLRPEIYTLNVDFEYLVCNRGDLVRVAHDVPLWGTGTGRIVEINGNTLTLSEPLTLVAGTQYQIRIRTNVVSSAPGATNSLLYQLIPVSTTGTYNTVTTTSAISGGVEVDNLYMLGEIAKESQELVVLSIEPSDNTSARLTLADYSPEIYTLDLNSEDDLPSRDPNITGDSNQAVLNTITQAPIIVGASSGSALAEEIATGTFQNVLLISFGNVPALSEAAQKMQVQVVLGDSDFSSGSLFGTYLLDKSTGSLSLTGLKTLTIYKIRARYTNASGTISGPWSPIFYTTSTGKVDNDYIVESLIVELDDVNITAVPATTLDKPADFKTFEYRLYKDTGNEDFWELDPATNGILVVQTTETARFNLLNVPQPRISTAGVTYRVACRAMDNNNNYSAQSALGTIVIATIK
jgi:hypothetical protein